MVQEKLYVSLLKMLGSSPDISFREWADGHLALFVWIYQLEEIPFDEFKKTLNECIEKVAPAYMQHVK